MIRVMILPIAFAVLVFAFIAIFRVLMLSRAGIRSINAIYRYNMSVISQKRYDEVIEYDEVYDFEEVFWKFRIWNVQQCFKHPSVYGRVKKYVK
jgi:hypothetical protein